MSVHTNFFEFFCPLVELKSSAYNPSLNVGQKQYVGTMLGAFLRLRKLFCRNKTFIKMKWVLCVANDIITLIILNK